MSVLVLGMCFFAGGTRFSEQGFGLGALCRHAFLDQPNFQYWTAASQINSSLLTLSVIAVLLPAAFDVSLRLYQQQDSNEGSDILNVSHGVRCSVDILFRLLTLPRLGCGHPVVQYAFLTFLTALSLTSSTVYISYLVFQLWSHTHLYNDVGDDVQISKKYNNLHRPDFMHMHRKANGDANGDADIPLEGTNGESSYPPENGDLEQGHAEEEEEEVETPQMSMTLSIFVLAVVTVVSRPAQRPRRSLLI